MKVVVAEKPSVAIDLARVMGASQKKDGYIEGAQYTFTWCYGHLLQLAPPETYGYKAFTATGLPMIPDKFLLIPRLDEKGNPDKGILKQISTITRLFKLAQEIIIATDAGREGELIFRYLYHHIGVYKPLKRLWLSSLTDKAIVEAFQDLKPGNEFERLYMAARSRSEADWLVGMNATTGLTVAVKSQKPLSLGRVQTPTLAMICSRFVENKNFVPEKYFQIELSLSKNEISFTATSESKFKTQADADQLLSKILHSKKAVVENFDKKEVAEQPPLLFDLTTLQQEANRKHGLSADETLKTAQSLYESKLITYPRTSSRYITEDLFEKIPGIIAVQMKHPKFSHAATGFKGQKLNRKSVNSSKVTDHHALLPTENFPTNLSKVESQVYDLISSRLLESFSGTCIKDATRIVLIAEKEQFVATGSVIKIPGWRSIWGAIEEKEENEPEDSNQQLPQLNKMEILPVKNAKVLNKQTKPKPLHTEATLLKAMETAGKEMDDETIREAIKEKGIGTAATRASMIEVLFKRKYIEKQKKSLVPTHLGMLVYDLVKEKSLASVELTGNWEHKFIQIEKGILSDQNFHTEIIQYTKSITQEILQVSGTNQQLFHSEEMTSKIPCPCCNSGHIRIFDKAANCSRSQEGCKFVIFRTICGKKITEKHIKDLITNRKTGLIKGFKSPKNGKVFDAFLVLDNHFKTNFSFTK